jgi:predicted Zn-dependent peptidase
MKLNSIQIKSGVNLHYLQTSKFKTTSLGFYFHRPLNRNEVTVNSLLSMVMRRGCPDYPTSRELAIRLDSLYAASLESGVRKKADSQIIAFDFTFANEKFIGNSEPVLENVLKIAYSLILKQDGFSEEHINQEKENLKMQILSQINDKRQYATQRCIEEMCKDEPYGTNKLGYVEDVDKITSNELYQHYKNVILKSPVDIFACGDIDIFWLEQQLRQMFSEIEISDYRYPKLTIIKEVSDVKNITDTEQIVQGKLSLGFRTKIGPTDARYPALMMYNSILGNGVFSKLFNNVREKLSLAYYASSNVDYLKGIMTINSGIEVENFQKAYDEILVQIEEIKKGNITDNELFAARLGTINSLKSLTDNAILLEDYYLGKLITGQIIEIDELVELIQGVTKEQIIDVSKGIELDTVYFLKGSEA